MEELMYSINLTSLLLGIIIIAFIKFREEYFVPSDTEIRIVVPIFIITILVFIVSAFILIWI